MLETGAEDDAMIRMWRGVRGTLGLLGVVIGLGCGAPSDDPTDAALGDASEGDSGFDPGAADGGADSGPADAGFDAGPVDETPPDLRILSPRAGTMSSGTQLVVRGVAADELALAEVVFADGDVEIPVEVAGDGSFAFVASLAPGANELRFRARDEAGNEVEAEVPVYFGHRITVGNSQAAAIRGDRLLTWGRNELGQLGNGTLEGSGWGDGEEASLPVNYEVALSGVVSIVSRQSFMVALLADGAVATWGSNDAHQLGYDAESDCGSTGTSECGRTPTLVPGVAGAVAVQAGFDHALVLLADGSVMSWGDNEFGQLGFSTSEDTGTPGVVVGLRDVVQLAAGATSSYAVDASGRVWAWGENDDAQLGLGTVDDLAHVVPTEIPGLSDVVAVAAANTTAFALLADGSVRAWGRNHAGQVGSGDDSGDDVLAPSAVMTLDTDGTPTPLRDVVNIAGDGFVGMALDASGRVYTWGWGRLGQLGMGLLEDGERDLDNRLYASPVVVDSADASVFDIVEIEAGAGGPTLALSQAGHLFGWGWSFRGALGIAASINAGAYTTPVLVLAAEREETDADE